MTVLRAEISAPRPSARASAHRVGPAVSQPLADSSPSDARPTKSARLAPEPAERAALRGNLAPEATTPDATTVAAARTASHITTETTTETTGETRAAGWIRDRPKRVFWLLVVIWVLSTADLAFTLWAHRYTPFVEANPIAASLLAVIPRGFDAHAAVYSSVIMLKLMTLVVGTYIFWPLRRHRPTEIGVWMLALALTYLMLLWSNYTWHFMEDQSWVQVSGELDENGNVGANPLRLTVLEQGH